MQGTGTSKSMHKGVSISDCCCCCCCRRCCCCCCCCDISYGRTSCRSKPDPAEEAEWTALQATRLQEILETDELDAMVCVLGPELGCPHGSIPLWGGSTVGPAIGCPHRGNLNWRHRPGCCRDVGVRWSVNFQNGGGITPTGTGSVTVVSYFEIKGPALISAVWSPCQPVFASVLQFGAQSLQTRET